MVHPLFMAEGMGWELSPTELREGSKAWLLALCQGGSSPHSVPSTPGPVCRGSCGQAPHPGRAKLCLVSAGQQLQGRAVPRPSVTPAGAAFWM